MGNDLREWKQNRLAENRFVYLVVYPFSVYPKAYTCISVDSPFIKESIQLYPTPVSWSMRKLLINLM